jgi:hypothetical protein
MSRGLKITLAPTNLVYNGVETVVRGSSLDVSARLTSMIDKPIRGRKLTFTGGAGTSTRQSCTALTNRHGYAACVMRGVTWPPSSTRVKILFKGDPEGLKHEYASTRSSALVTVT